MKETIMTFKLLIFTNIRDQKARDQHKI